MYAACIDGCDVGSYIYMNMDSFVVSLLMAGLDAHNNCKLVLISTSAAMEVEQPVASLSPSAEEAPALGVYANGGLVENPAGDAADNAREEPVSEASGATEEQTPASPKPKATISPDAKPLKKNGSSPPKGTTTKSRAIPSGAGAPSVRKVGIILYLHHLHLEVSLKLPWLIPRAWP
jgi:hypothetical protein